MFPEVSSNSSNPLLQVYVAVDPLSLLLVNTAAPLAGLINGHLPRKKINGHGYVTDSFLFFLRKTVNVVVLTLV